MLSKTVMVLGSFFLWCMWSETDEKNREAKSYKVGENSDARSFPIIQIVRMCVSVL